MMNRRSEPFQDFFMEILTRREIPVSHQIRELVVLLSSTRFSNLTMANIMGLIARTNSKIVGCG
uniref:Uncharacterized protein n=1 Tax=Arundo donax TaxID=35708 RepID=A0A0A8YM09_ARUDO